MNQSNFEREMKIQEFFQKHSDALPLYEALEARILTEIGEDTEIRVQKTQISFYQKHMFACVSFAGVRKKKDCPPVYLVVTVGLSHKLESPRIDAATEPYPNRWTHHILISGFEEIDEELMGWLKEAAEFAAMKR